MSISLKPEHEQFVQSQVTSGKFANADEVIGEALKLLEEREQRLEELRQKIVIGAEQIFRGQVTDGDVVFDRLQEKIRQISQSES